MRPLLYWPGIFTARSGYLKMIVRLGSQHREDGLPSLHSLSEVLFEYLIVTQLIAQRQPPWSRVVLASKYFNLAASRAHPFYHAVYFIGLATCLTDLRDNDVRVKPTIHPRWKLEVPMLVRNSFNADQHVLLGMIQPVSRTPGTYDTLELYTKGEGDVVYKYRWTNLVGLDPNHFVDTGVTPNTHALAANFHCAPCHPKEEQSFILEHRNRHSPHLIVGHCAVWKLKARISTVSILQI